MYLKRGRFCIGVLCLGVLWCVAGCSQRPPEAFAALLEVSGRVLAEPAIQRPAVVSLRLYSLMGGRPMLIAQSRYTVSLLPLHFTFRPAALQRGGGAYWLRSELRWLDSTEVQARSWQSVTVDETVLVHLCRLPCHTKGLSFDGQQ